MSEVQYRFIIGSLLVLFLLIESKVGVTCVSIILVFEAISNIYIAALVTKLRKGETQKLPIQRVNYRFNFEAERLMRLILVSCIIVGGFLFPENFWFLPWFVSIMFFLSGITKICIMTILLKKLGFK